MRLAKKDANHDELANVLAAISEATEDTHRLGGGLADYLALLRDGYIHFFEFKTENGTLTPAEARFHEKFTGAKNLHIVRAVEDTIATVEGIQ